MPDQNQLLDLLLMMQGNKAPQLQQPGETLQVPSSRYGTPLAKTLDEQQQGRDAEAATHALAGRLANKQADQETDAYNAQFAGPLNGTPREQVQRRAAELMRDVQHLPPKEQRAVINKRLYALTNLGNPDGGQFKSNRDFYRELHATNEARRMIEGGANVIGVPAGANQSIAAEDAMAGDPSNPGVADTVRRLIAEVGIPGESNNATVRK